MSLPLTFAGGSTNNPSGALRWDDGPRDFLIWEGNPDTGALLWNTTEDGLVWE